MKIFIAYKFARVDKCKLRKLLKLVADALHTQGIETFEFYRDVQKWGTVKLLSTKEIISRALEEVKKCDAILAVVDHSEKSGGMLLEVGCAKAMGKKFYLAIAKDVKDNVDRFLFALADEVIEYDSETTLKDSLRRKFGKLV